MNLNVIKTPRPVIWSLASKGLAVAELVGLRQSKLVADRIIEKSCKREKSSNHQLHGLYAEGFERLIKSLNEESGMDPLGLAIAEKEISDWLSNRIRLNDSMTETGPSNFPDDQVFIIGFPRTGSTLLHNLLALEDEVRTPKLWELFHPVPYPELENYTTDNRIQIMDKELQLLDKLSPLSRKIHPMEAHLPEECHYLMGVDFVGPGFCLYYNVPGYWEWLKTLDFGALGCLYENYKKYISYLCTEVGGKRWLSKSGVHLFFYEVLSDVLPSSKIVRLHRDPCESIPSFGSLLASYWQIYNTRLDYKRIGAMCLDMYKVAMNRSIEASKTLEKNRYVDVHYQDLVKEPLSTLEMIYERFNYKVTDKLMDQWKNYLSNHPKNKTGKHIYTLETFGLSRQQIHRELNDYINWLESTTGRVT